MSFSSEVKEELSHVDGHENHCMIAELAAIIGLCGKIKCEDGRYSLILHTENVSVARRFYSLIKDVFHFQPQVSTTQHEFLKKESLLYDFHRGIWTDVKNFKDSTAYK